MRLSNLEPINSRRRIEAAIGHLASTVAARAKPDRAWWRRRRYLRCEVPKNASTATSRGGAFALDWRSVAIELSRGQRIRVGGEIYSEGLASRRVAGVQAGPLGLGDQPRPSTPADIRRSLHRVFTS